MGYIEENINAIEEMTITSNEPFRVRNLHDVNSVLKTIKNLNDQISTYKDFAEEEIAKVTKWYTETIRPLETSVEHYTAMLTEYFLEEKRKNPNIKSISAPNGKFNSRTTKKIVYDNDKMLSYLKENHQDLIKTTETFNKNEVKKLFVDGIDIETGEIIDWVSTEESTTYRVKID